MTEIRINDKISYIETSDNPLCADIGIIKDNGQIWLFDVGNGENNIKDLNGNYNVVLSHFHLDHTGNLDKINANDIYLSKESFNHFHKGTIIQESTNMGNLHIFPLPSSHAKGCLGLEIDETYAFVGDGLYSKVKDGYYIYNAQLLQKEIEVLKNLKASILLVSHHQGLTRSKDDVIKELEMIYNSRIRNNPEIRIKITDWF